MFSAISASYATVGVAPWFKDWQTNSEFAVSRRERFQGEHQQSFAMAISQARGGLRGSFPQPQLLAADRDVFMLGAAPLLV